MLCCSRLIIGFVFKPFSFFVSLSIVSLCFQAAHVYLNVLLLELNRQKNRN